MTTGAASTVVSSEVRRNTIVNLKQVNELPLRNALESFDRNGDGKIDISELQKIIYWYGLWKYASFGLCLVIMTLVWSKFSLTIWAINLTKDYTVTDGVLTGGDEVVKMSVASTYIPLSWASLLDRRHLDALESISIDVTQSSGKFAAGVYHVKVASYMHVNSTYLKLFGADGSRVWVNSGAVVLHHPDAVEAVMVCGAAACNTLAVDVKPEYLEHLIQRSAEVFSGTQDFELPASIEGVAINKAAGKDVTCMARMHNANADVASGRSLVNNIYQYGTINPDEGNLWIRDPVYPRQFLGGDYDPIRNDPAEAYVFPGQPLYQEHFLVERTGDVTDLFVDTSITTLQQSGNKGDFKVPGGNTEQDSTVGQMVTREQNQKLLNKASLLTGDGIDYEHFNGGVEITLDAEVASQNYDGVGAFTTGDAHLPKDVEINFVSPAEIAGWRNLASKKSPGDTMTENVAVAMSDVYTNAAGSVVMTGSGNIAQRAAAPVVPAGSLPQGSSKVATHVNRWW